MIGIRSQPGTIPRCQDESFHNSKVQGSGFRGSGFNNF
jgi:hypothetical protein